MRAVVVNRPGPPQVMELIDLPEPLPGVGEVSIEVDYAGVGFVDTLFRAGTFPMPAPFTPGIEVAGRVRRIGQDVRDLQPGQRVAALLNDFGRGSQAGGYTQIGCRARSCCRCSY